jgi:prolipoprotein diacylglyceryltransferase
MSVNLTAYFLLIGGGVLAGVLWFFLSDRRRAGDGKSLPLAISILLLGALLGLACARVTWVLCRINTRPALFSLRYNELSYYGGVAGVILAVVLSAKLFGRPVRDTLNTFAPMGALIAAVTRFGEGFLGLLGMGQMMEEGIFFPVTAEIAWDEYYSEFYPAVFMLEGLFSLAAMVLSLVHG